MNGSVDELAYVVLDTRNPGVWSSFATDILGFEVVERGASLHLRMDARPFRYLLRQGPGEGLPLLGWQVKDASTLAGVAERLAELGLDVAMLPNGDLSERQAEGGVRFRCSNGISHEVVFGLSGDRAFVPSGDGTGFITSPGGLGHVVWSVPDTKAMDRLMLEAFGMALREDISTPAGPAHFFGCNARHHSLAAFSLPNLRLEHLMVEMKELDDVGRAMDRAIERNCTITQPLGRHRTDHMVSFYVETPGGFAMEIGCDGVLCGDNWADVRDASRRRPWGHGDAMRKHQKKFATPAPQERITNGA